MREKYRSVSAILNSPNNASSCGIYPTLDPGTPQPGVPGSSPKTVMLPELSLSFPTMHFNKVVFPHPEGPVNEDYIL